MEELVAAGVEFTAKPAQTGLLGPMLGWILPVIPFVVIWWFLMKKMGGGGRGMRVCHNEASLRSNLKQAQQIQNPFRSLVFVDVIQAFDPLPVFQGNLPADGICILGVHGRFPFSECCGAFIIGPIIGCCQ